MASKKGPLSKAEVFYIQEHVKAGKDINEIASDLDRALKSIQKCVTQAQKSTEQNKFIAGNQFAKKNGSVIMTENASTIADSRRKKGITARTQNCITKVKVDEQS